MRVSAKPESHFESRIAYRITGVGAQLPKTGEAFSIEKSECVDYSP